MKKRLFLAVLAIVMLMSCILTGCTEEQAESNVDLVDTEGYACIKVYGVKEASTTDEAIAAVEEAINKITLKEFKTKVKLMLFTEDKYLEGIDEALKGLEELEAAKKKEKADARAEAKRLAKLKEEDYEAYRKEIAAQQAEEKRLAEEKAEKEAQMQEEAEAAGIEYIPEIEIPEHAIDVLLVRDIQELKAFKEEGYLKTISEQISLDYKKIGKFIHPTLLNMGRANGALCAVVNNTFAGQSQYAVFDTELYEKYAGELTEVGNIASLRKFLETVKANEADVIPMLNTPEFVQGVDFVTSIKNPIGVYNPDKNEETEITIGNIFASNPVQAHFNNILTYRNAGYLPAADAQITDDTKWALKFVTGDEYTKRDYEEKGYTVLTYAAPRITDENCNFSYYAVYSETEYESRSLSFIELLTTDKELQTIFAYGIEGVNYELVDGKVKMLNDTYSINKRYMGNRFVGYPTVDEEIDIFDVAIERNQTAVVSSLYGQNFDLSNEYIQNYTIDKVNINVEAAAASASGETFGYFITGSYKADEYSTAYLQELEGYCISYAINGSVFMVSPYVEEQDGFYVGSTTKSKYGLKTGFNEVVKADTVPAELLELMKTVSAADNDEMATKLITDEATGKTTYYAVAPMRHTTTDKEGNSVTKTTGIVCSTTNIDDTMKRLEEILAEYWDDITTGIPDSSIDRFAMKVVTKIEENDTKVYNAKQRLAAADTAEAKESAKVILESLPSNETIVRDMLLGISESADVVNAYTKRILDYYKSYDKGTMSKAAYCAAVKTLIKGDFTKIWNMWDEITDMNNRFTNETNLNSLLEILEKQYNS